MKKTEKLVESKTMVMRGRMTVVSKGWGKGKRKPPSLPSLDDTRSVYQNNWTEGNNDDAKG